MRIPLALAALVLSVTSLTACGSDKGGSSSSGSSDNADSAYCQELKADKAYFASFSNGNPDISKLDDAFARLHSLAGKAPDSVKDDWAVLDGALTKITAALKAAGISFADIAKMQQGQVPKGVDPQKLAALAPKLQQMASPKVENASKAIEKHARTTCKVKLGAS